MAEMKTLNLFGTVFEVVDEEARNNAAAIIEEYLSNNPITTVKGADGGYYTPTVTQPNATTMVLSFTPSKDDMPAIDNVSISLPANVGSGNSGSEPTYGKLVVFGDSIGAGYLNNDYSFVDILSESGKFTSVVKHCVAGATVGPYSVIQSGTGYSLVEQIERYSNDIVNADIVVCEYEGNDIWALMYDAVSIGSVDDASTATTVCGYTKKALERIYEINPNVRIVWMPVARNNYAWLRKAFADSIDKADTFLLYEATVLKIAASYNCSIISIYNAFNVGAYKLDDLHLNTEGHKRIAEKVLHNMFVESDSISITRPLISNGTSLDGTFKYVLALLYAGVSVPFHYVYQGAYPIIFYPHSYNSGSICFDGVVSYDNNATLKHSRVVWKSDGTVQTIEKAIP